MRAYKSLVKEISRPFTTSAVLDIIRDCVGRDAEWIQAYASEHLKLLDSVEDCVPTEQDVLVQPATLETGSVFPKEDEDLPGQPAHLAIDPRPDSGRLKPPGSKLDDREKLSHPKQPSRLDRLGTFSLPVASDWTRLPGVFAIRMALLCAGGREYLRGSCRLQLA